MTEAIISIKDLHKYYGHNEVLKGIDLDIMPGGCGDYWPFWFWKIDLTSNYESFGSTN